MKVFFEAFFAGGFTFLGLIVAFEIAKGYALGDKLKDIFLSEEAKIVSARNKFVAAQKNLVAKLRTAEKKVL